MLRTTKVMAEALPLLVTRYGEGEILVDFRRGWADRIRDRRVGGERAGDRRGMRGAGGRKQCASP